MLESKLSDPSIAPSDGGKWQAISAIVARATELHAPEHTRRQLFELASTLGNLQHDAPTREIFARLGDRWSTLLLLLLNRGEFRNVTLKRLAGLMSYEQRISPRMLVLSLRNLERDGLVAHTVLNTRPRGMQYSLTEMGRELVQQVEGLLHWIAHHDQAIENCRRRFDAALKPKPTSL